MGVSKNEKTARRKGRETAIHIIYYFIYSRLFLCFVHMMTAVLRDKTGFDCSVTAMRIALCHTRVRVV